LEGKESSSSIAPQLNIYQQTVQKIIWFEREIEQSIPPGER